MKATSKMSGFMISEIIPELVVMRKEVDNYKRKSSSREFGEICHEHDDAATSETSFKYDADECDEAKIHEKYESFDESPIHSDQDDEEDEDAPLKNSSDSLLTLNKYVSVSVSSNASSSSPPRAASSPNTFDYFDNAKSSKKPRKDDVYHKKSLLFASNGGKTKTKVSSKCRTRVETGMANKASASAVVPPKTSLERLQVMKQLIQQKSSADKGFYVAPVLSSIFF